MSIIMIRKDIRNIPCTQNRFYKTVLTCLIFCMYFDIFQKYKQFLETWYLKNKKNIIIIMTQLCDMSHHLYALKVNYRPCDGRLNSVWLETKLLWHVPLRLVHIVMQIKLQCIFQLSWNLMRQLLLTLKYSPG